MDPAPLTALVQTQVVQAILARIGAGTQQNLMSMLGQSLEVTFQGMGPEGAQLALPSGQTLVAQGELPFAQGTLLTLKVLPERDGTLRLQIQEAKPPATPALLQPLLAGEAQPLAARLTEQQPPESLAPLVRMLQQVLASVKPQAPMEAATPAAPVSVPTLPAIQEALAALPPELLQPLRQALALPSGQPLAPTLKAWIENLALTHAPQAPVSADSNPQVTQGSPTTPRPQATATTIEVPPVLGTLVQDFSALIRQAPGVPDTQQDVLATWFRALLGQGEGPVSVASEAAALPASAPASAPPPQAQAALPAILAKLPEAVASLSPQAAMFLRQAMGIPQGQSLAEGLKTWIEAALPSEQPGALTSAESRLRPALFGLPELVQHFEVLVLQAPDFPKPQRAILTSWFRDLLVKASGSEATPQIATLAETHSSQAPKSSQPSQASAEDGKPVSLPRTVVASPSGEAASAQSPLEEPAFWGKWVRGTVEALADPQVSPREAPFHALQAKEGTAYFELPAPWLPQGTVQLWVESDSSDPGRPEDGTRRVFMGLHFSNLGDTRLGMELSGTNLRVRVWAEHPERLAAQEAALTKELQETGCQVSLRILPLAPGSESLRALAVGNSWQGLG